MTKDELYNLLDELSLPDSIIGRLDAPKWCFWQRKGQIQENEALTHRVSTLQEVNATQEETITDLQETNNSLSQCVADLTDMMLGEM